MSQKSKESSSEALLNAARALVARRGFDGASTRAIAEHAGANIALIPYHFGSKEGLLAKLIEGWTADLLVRLRVASEVQGKSGSKLPAVVDAFLRFSILESPECATIMARESMLLEPTQVTARIAEAVQPVSEFLDTIVPATSGRGGATVVAVLLGIAGVAGAMPSLAYAPSRESAFERARQWAGAVLEISTAHVGAPAVTPVFRPIPETASSDFLD
ncbi:MAG: TetR family transcriptional regulator [Candidatus Hydrogenedentes bacterium]|nr:TetR family transcriptional regulator [Candidatus Hydrogenedentota bacterium]